MRDKLDNEYLVDLIWHWKVQDNLNWKFCSDILLQDESITISPAKLKNKFNKYFKDLTGAIPYTECPKCGNKIIPKEGKYSKFLGCSSYPACKYIAGVPNANRMGKTEKEIQEEVNELLKSIGLVPDSLCPKCDSKLVPRDGKDGRFVGCSSYPDCNYIARPKRTRRTQEQIQKEKEELSKKLFDETGYVPYEPCPSCGKELLPRDGAFGMFVGCSGYPDCKFIASSTKKQQEAIQQLKEATGYEPDMDCPECGSKLKLCRGSLRFFIGCSNYPQCNFIAESQEVKNARSNFAKLELMNAENIKKIAEELNKFTLCFDGVRIKRRGRNDYIAEIEGLKTNKNIFTYWLLWDSVKFQIGNDGANAVYIKQLQELETCNCFRLIENKYNELIGICRRKK